MFQLGLESFWFYRSLWITDDVSIAPQYETLHNNVLTYLYRQSFRVTRNEQIVWIMKLIINASKYLKIMNIVCVCVCVFVGMGPRGLRKFVASTILAHITAGVQHPHVHRAYR